MVTCRLERRPKRRVLPNEILFQLLKCAVIVTKREENIGLLSTTRCRLVDYLLVNQHTEESIWEGLNDGLIRLNERIRESALCEGLCAELHCGVTPCPT